MFIKKRLQYGCFPVNFVKFLGKHIVEHLRTDGCVIDLKELQNHIFYITRAWSLFFI